MPLSKAQKLRYGPDWPLRSRFVRLVRSRGMCEKCGAVNGQKNPATGSIVVLTAAHIFDDRPENNSLLNLMALCQRCHFNHDRPGNVAKRRERKARGDDTPLGLAIERKRKPDKIDHRSIRMQWLKGTKRESET